MSVITTTKLCKSPQTKISFIGRLDDFKFSDSPESPVLTSFSQTTQSSQSSISIFNSLNSQQQQQCQSNIANSLQKIPTLLEYSLSYNETIVSLFDRPIKPIHLFDNNELVAWLETFANESFSRRVANKGITGKVFLEWYKKSVTKYCGDIEDVERIIKTVKQYITASTFPMTVLQKNSFTDEELRDMYDLEANFTRREPVNLSSVDKAHAIRITFLSIEIFFARRDPILVAEDVENLREGLFETPFDVLTLSTENLNILKRVFLFIERMTASENSLFNYYKAELEDFMISCMAPGLSVEPIKVIKKHVKEETNPYFCYESSELYPGELVELIISDVLVPLYLIPYHQKISTIVNVEWENGVLYVTNYRIVWRSYSQDTPEVRASFEMLYQVPIRLILEHRSDCIIENEEESVYLLRVLSRSAHSHTFGMTCQENIKMIEDVIQKSLTQVILFDKYDVFVNKIVLIDVAEKLYKRLKNKTNLQVNNEPNTKGMGECAVTLQEYPLNYNHIKGKIGVVLVGESENNGRVYRLQIASDMKAFDKTYFEDNNINVVEFE
ncbi:protein kinase, putative, partial [Entamoeba invadens IP1]